MELRRHAVGGVNQPIWVQQATLQEAAAHSSGAVEDGRCFLEPAENASGHGPKPAWPRLTSWIQQTPETIQVMAKDPRALRGQLVRQMSITVVTDVEAVKIAQPRSEMPGIVPKAVQQPIGVESNPSSLEHGQALEARNQARTNARCLHSLHVETP